MTSTGKVALVDVFAKIRMFLRESFQAFTLVARRRNALLIVGTSSIVTLAFFTCLSVSTVAQVARAFVTSDTIRA